VLGGITLDLAAMTSIQKRIKIHFHLSVILQKDKQKLRSS